MIPLAESWFVWIDPNGAVHLGWAGVALLFFLVLK